MLPSNPQIELSDLRRAHDLAAHQFPHEYLDVGLGAVGLFLHNPPKNAGYRSTPLNSITFASIGVDGIHFSSITDFDRVEPSSPVVITIPMAIENPNYIVGCSLYDFLCLGCRHGYSKLGNLHLRFDETIHYYQSPPRDFYDQRCPGILQTLTDACSLQPWTLVHEHFIELQRQYTPLLKLPAKSI